jgi:uncharacterized glyoxalase superfamily protein PhnB
MQQHIAQVALLVNDYDEAIAFYTQQLSFNLLEDVQLPDGKRWVLIAPSGGNGCRLLLAKAEGEKQKVAVGNQTGGRVFLFLNTDNFERDYNNLLQNKVTIFREPVTEIYGTGAVFADLYGNLWDLIQPASSK